MLHLISLIIQLPTQLFLFITFKLILIKPKIELNFSPKSNASYIIVANHPSALDPFAIVSSLTWSAFFNMAPFSFMTANYFYKFWWLRPFLWAAGCFPAHPLNQKSSSYGISGAVTLLGRGYSLVMFPEGKRTKTGRLPARPGITKILSSHTNTKIILSHIQWQTTLRIKRIVMQSYSGSFDAEEILTAVYKT